VPLIYTACRTCYSELAPDDIFERAVDGRITPEKQRELIGRVIESGHGSTIEHVVFTFAITGVSRTLSHQLVRHRVGVAFDQQSQRYVSYKKGASTMLPATIAEADPQLRHQYEEQVEGALELYSELLEAGVPVRTPAFVFPNATRTNLVMTANLRALIHMSGLRLCTMAQWEIRRLFQLHSPRGFRRQPFLGSFLAPKCVPSDTATRPPTGTSIAPSARTRTESSRPGRTGPVGPDRITRGQARPERRRQPSVGALTGSGAERYVRAIGPGTSSGVLAGNAPAMLQKSPGRQARDLQQWAGVSRCRVPSFGPGRTRVVSWVPSSGLRGRGRWDHGDQRERVGSVPAEPIHGGSDAGYAFVRRVVSAG